MTFYTPPPPLKIKATTTTKQKHSDKKQQILIKYKSLAAYNIMFPFKKLYYRFFFITEYQSEI